MASQTAVLTVVVVEQQVLNLFFVEVCQVFETLFCDELVLESFDTSFDFRVFVRLTERDECEFDSLFFAESTELVGASPHLFPKLVPFVFSFEKVNELSSIVDSKLVRLSVFFDELFGKIDGIVRALLLVRKSKERSGTVVYSNVIIRFSDSFDAELFEVQAPQLVWQFFGSVRSTLSLSLFSITIQPVLFQPMFYCGGRKLDPVLSFQSPGNPFVT